MSISGGRKEYFHVSMTQPARCIRAWGLHLPLVKTQGTGHCHAPYPNLVKSDVTGNIPHPHDSREQGTVTVLPRASSQNPDMYISSPSQTLTAATSRPSHQSKDKRTWCFLNPSPKLRKEIKYSLLPPSFKPCSQVTALTRISRLNQLLLCILSTWFYSVTVCFWNDIQIFQAPLTDTKFYMDHHLSFEASTE